ncbi:MAG: tetratricopeptide repeat protein, partial [Hyphomicrobiaceae bacterium]
MSEPPSHDSPTYIIMPPKMPATSDAERAAADVAVAPEAVAPETAAPVADTHVADTHAADPHAADTPAAAASPAPAPIGGSRAAASALPEMPSAPASPAEAVGAASPEQRSPAAVRAKSRRRSVLDGDVSGPEPPARASHDKRPEASPDYGAARPRGAGRVLGADLQQAQAPLARVSPLILAVLLIVPLLLLVIGAYVLSSSLDRWIASQTRMVSAPAGDDARPPTERLGPQFGERRAPTPALPEEPSRPGGRSPVSEALNGSQDRARPPAAVPQTAEDVKRAVERSGKPNAAAAARAIDLGRQAQIARDYATAARHYSDAIAAGADEAGIYLLRGDVHDELGRYDEALSDYSAAISRSGDFAMAYNYRAITLRRMKRFEAALSDCNKAVALDGRNAPFLMNRGLILTDLGKYAEAIADFDAALTIRTDYTDALINRAVAHMRSNNMTAARRDYDKALLRAPDNRLARLGSAALHNATGDYAKARAEADLVLQRNPRDADGLIERAVASFRTGDVDASLADLDTAVDSD